MLKFDKSFELKTFSSKKDTSFLILTNPKSIGKANTFIQDKIHKRTFSHDTKIWGTIGNADNSQLNWSGNVKFSKEGRFKSEGITKEVKKLLQESLGTNRLKEHEIQERYITFDEVHFNKKKNTDLSNKIRLTLFIPPDEGALVFYQHYDESELNYSDPANKHKGFDFDYILPKATRNSNQEIDFNIKSRDRLDYFFDIIPTRKLKDAGVIGVMNKMRFVIKILTFKRTADNNETIIEKAEEKIFKVDKRYNLLVFDKQKDKFVSAGRVNPIEENLKTLFLIHGTFSTTERSYEYLMEKENGSSWLKSHLLSNQSQYKQVIGFDHPTWLDDAQENAAHLMFELDKIKPGFCFSQDVDFIGTSRGALVGKYLGVEYLKRSENNSKIPIAKGVTVAGANGVGYLKLNSPGGSFLLNAFFKLLSTTMPQAKILVNFAQLSTKYFITRQGAQLMTPRHEKLRYILNSSKENSTNIEILPLEANFKNEKLDKRLLNFLIRRARKPARRFLGIHHDFVVGTREQRLTSPFKESSFPHSEVFDTIHGRILNKKNAKELIERYFLE